MHDVNHKCLVSDKELICDIPLCSQICKGYRELLKHLKQHIQDGVTVKCPFEKCCKSFKLKSSFSSHVSRCHEYNNVHNSLDHN